MKPKKQFIIGFAYKESLLVDTSNITYWLGHLNMHSKRLWGPCLSVDYATVFSGKTWEEKAEEACKYIENLVKADKEFDYLKKYSLVRVDYTVKTMAVLW